MNAGRHKTWFKSTHSAAASHCLEVAFGGDETVYIRDSKNPRGATLPFGLSVWNQFIADVKDGRFSRR